MNIKRRLQKLEDALIPGPDTMPGHEEIVFLMDREMHRMAIQAKNTLGDDLTPGDYAFMEADTAEAMEADHQLWERANRFMSEDPWFVAILEEGEVADYQEWTRRIFPINATLKHLWWRLDKAVQEAQGREREDQD